MTECVYHTSSGDIRYWISRVSEEARWLVFLPGLSADHTLFEKQIEYFGGKANCFVWDAPGHGVSRPFALDFTMRGLVKWLDEILAQEGIKMPVLIGQSLGGYIAQVYMDEYPERVQGFVSIDSCSMSRKYYTGWELALLKRTKWMYLSIPYPLLLRWGVWGTATTVYGRALMEKMWSSYGKKEFCELADFGYRMLAQAVEEKDEYPISCPAMLICGERDAAGSAKSYNRRWTKLDGHPLHWIKGAGHNANTDAPQEVNGLIDVFIKGLECTDV